MIRNSIFGSASAAHVFVAVENGKLLSDLLDHLSAPLTHGLPPSVAAMTPATRKALHEEP
jgi:hypothetical protein